MKKTNFKISVCKDNEKSFPSVSGYTVECGGVRYGITNKNVNGGALGAWHISELTTGFAVSWGYKTMREAISAAADFRDRVSAFVEKYTANGGEDVNQDINPTTYVIWGAHTAKTA